MCLASWPGVVVMIALWLGPEVSDNRLMDVLTIKTEGHALADARSSIWSSIWFPKT